MNGLLIDTHALLWLVTGDAALGAVGREMADRSLAENTLFASAISFWEIALLARLGRIEIGSVRAVRTGLLQSGLKEMPLTSEVGIAAADLAEFHRDPADRFIVATALGCDFSLVTADERILRWPGTLVRHNARL
ncbi:MAG: toxin of toxin-antitoxin system [Dehalococcoidia bacterium]|nr:toxin of toxin-antitoxin system [Dehalococcoidia bacterium]